jgi:SAM-dependent methyltransferase
MKWLRRLFFSVWYFFNPPWDTGVSPPELMEHIRTHPSGWALDLGCGTGTNVITLAQRGWRATGVDFAPTAIREARRKAEKAGVQATFQVADVTRLEDLKSQFDLVLDMGCFHSLPSHTREAYIQNLERLLDSGGTYLLYAFTDGEVDGGSGISSVDLDRLSSTLILVDRVDGTERGERSSAWFTFRKP